MRSMYQVLSKQERLQVASEGGTMEIRVSQFIRQCIPSCRRSHCKGTTTIRVQLEPWGDEHVAGPPLLNERCTSLLSPPPPVSEITYIVSSGTLNSTVPYTILTKFHPQGCQIDGGGIFLAEITIYLGNGTR